MTEQQRKQKREREREYLRYNFLRIWQRRYAHMKARAEGRSTNKSAAGGKLIITQEEFFAWCKSDDVIDVFLVMWSNWAQNGFRLWDAPSVDRIESDKGYTIDNIQWMPFAENCRKNNRNPIDHSEEVW